MGSASAQTIKLVYFDTLTDRVYCHLFMPLSILTNGAVFVNEKGEFYTVKYYDEQDRVAFAVRRVEGEG